MSITIAIATHNRAAELRKTLDGLVNLDLTRVPPFEILVVANNCTDRTRDVVTEFSRHYPDRFRYVEEPRPGLSHARNRSVAAALYDIVAFLDDDVDVDSNWLAALWAAYGTGDYAAVGGRAYLIYPDRRPPWLGPRCERLLTMVDHGPSRRPAEADELYGLNLSIRKRWINQVGGFRTDLGRVGKCLLSSEESELLTRVVLAGGSLLYDPAAVVGHRVPHERLRRRWFWARCYWGRLGEMRIVPDEDVSLLALGRAGWRVLRAAVPAAQAMLTQGPRSERFFDASTRVAARVGDCLGLCVRLRQRYSGAPAFHETGESPEAP